MLLIKWRKPKILNRVGKLKKLRIMKHKLVLVFDDDSKVVGIDNVLMFNNVLDAETYLRSTGLDSVTIEPDDRWFCFKTNTWNGSGRAYWVVDRS